MGQKSERIQDAWGVLRDIYGNSKERLGQVEMKCRIIKEVVRGNRKECVEQKTGSYEAWG